ncbi:HK97 gp10 family phage protein [Methyloversatilis sp.]|uniref:HK97 gp10 family phage protein n=1 Tax=Methyloversatilis sp. TaxID=2569862 RepID=UPI003D2D9FD1
MSFTADIRTFVKKANGNVQLAVRQTVVLVAQGLIMTTPVDTGRARANWVFGAGRADVSFEWNRYDPGGNSALARIAAQATAQYQPIMYVTNSLPYIGRLETGYSKQAPAGMVMVTLTDIQRRLDAYVRGLA